MDWNDIETASHPYNDAYTVNQLIGHTLILLKREAPRTPFITPGDAQSYIVPVSRAVRVLNAIWRKQQRLKQDDIVAVVRRMELALDTIQTWFRQGITGGAEAVLAEKAFNDAATRIYRAEGYSWRGDFSGYLPSPTPDELEADRITLLQDAQRLAALETQPPEEWLRQAADARRKRGPWEAAAVDLMDLRNAIDNAIPLGAQPEQRISGGRLAITL